MLHKPHNGRILLSSLVIVKIASVYKAILKINFPTKNLSLYFTQSRYTLRLLIPEQFLFLSVAYTLAAVQIIQYTVRRKETKIFN